MDRYHNSWLQQGCDGVVYLPHDHCLISYYGAIRSHFSIFSSLEPTSHLTIKSLRHATTLADKRRKYVMVKTLRSVEESRRLAACRKINGPIIFAHKPGTRDSGRLLRRLHKRLFPSGFFLPFLPLLPTYLFLHQPRLTSQRCCGSSMAPVQTFIQASFLLYWHR